MLQGMNLQQTRLQFPCQHISFQIQILQIVLCHQENLCHILFHIQEICSCSFQPTQKCCHNLSLWGWQNFLYLYSIAALGNLTCFLTPMKRRTSLKMTCCPIPLLGFLLCLPHLFHHHLFLCSRQAQASPKMLKSYKSNRISSS